MTRLINALFIAILVRAGLAQKCNNSIVSKVTNTAAVTKQLSVLSTLRGWPNNCLTVFQLVDKTKSLAIQPAGLAATMNTFKTKLCKDGVAGIQFYDNTVKKVDYCTGKCAAGTKTTYSDTEVILKKPMVRVYNNCPIPFTPTVSYRVVA